MYNKSRCVILHTMKYNDDSLIVHALSETDGCVSFLVKISHARRAAVRYTLFQSLALLEIEWTQRKPDDLCKPTAARVDVPFTSIPFDPYKSAIAMFLAEFLRYALRAEPASSNLFEYIYRSVEWLDTSVKGASNFHLVFLLRLTRFLGFFPDIQEAAPGCYFDLLNCVFTPVRPSHASFLTPVDADLLPVLMRIRYENMRFFKFSGAERNRFLSVLNDYYQMHIPNFPELKSLSVLRDLFS